jgi:ABC-type Fe3+/spermidine/putrescine transport system ATPase subunit
VASDGLPEERLVSDGLTVTKPTADAGNAHIEVKDLVVQYGHVMAVRGVSFAVRLGEQLTLLGPSGCGKTTTLRAIAGLEPPTSGEIVIGGTPVFSSVKRISVPAERRGLSMVFQSYAIWPHMTVFDNVAYGLRVRRMGGREIAEKVGSALDMVQMGDFAQRSASKLSGGQQQRVALARAFVFSPSVLLFDEPLSNLDAKLRAEMRIELRELQHRVGITSVYVTHDLEEALAISDRIVVMRDGVIAQIGSPFEIYNYPRNAFVADFVGSANLIRGRHRPECGRDGLIALETAGGTLVYGTAHGRPIGAEGVFSVRTIHLGLSREAPPAQANVWPVRVRRSVFQGDFTQYQVDWEDRQLVVRCTAADPLAEGEQAYLAVEPRRCVLLEAEPAPA